MAKRTRGTNRPGQRHASHPRHQSRPVGRPDTGLSSAEEARAAELEQEIVARDRAAQSTVGGRGREESSRSRLRSGSPLAVRAAEEYGYVSRDVGRIIRIGGSMIAIMALFYVLVDVAKVIKIS